MLFILGVGNLMSMIKAITNDDQLPTCCKCKFPSVYDQTISTLSKPAQCYKDNSDRHTET